MVDVGEFVWKTADGRELTLGQIGDRHLLNIIRMLERQHAAFLSQSYMALGFLQGEMATYCAEQDIDREDQMFTDTILFLKAEAKERGLHG